MRRALAPVETRPAFLCPPRREKCRQHCRARPAFHWLGWFSGSSLNLDALFPSWEFLVTFVRRPTIFRWPFPPSCAYLQIGATLPGRKKKEPLMSVPRPRPIIPICKHVLESGSRCQGAAVSGRTYCRHHLGSRIRLRRLARMRRHCPALPPILLTDAAGIHHAAVHIDAGLSNGRIDSASGPLLFSILRMAQSLNRIIERQSKGPSRGGQRAAANRDKLNVFYYLPISP